MNKQCVLLLCVMMMFTMMHCKQHQHALFFPTDNQQRIGLHLSQIEQQYNYKEEQCPFTHLQMTFVRNVSEASSCQFEKLYLNHIGNTMLYNSPSSYCIVSIEFPVTDVALIEL
jgi:hypothetical protein